MFLLSLLTNWVHSASVLIIYDSYTTEVTGLQSFLNANGHTATLSATVETSYTGSNPSLNGIDVVGPWPAICFFGPELAKAADG